MHTLLKHSHAPRLLAAFGTLTLLAGIGLFASSRPARSVGGPVAVTVANAPLSTTAADNPAKQPFQQTSVIDSNNTYINFATVPVGKRLVIESLAAFSNTPNDTHSHNVTVFPSANGYIGLQAFTLMPSAVPYSTVNQKVLIYANAGDTLRLLVQTSGNTAPEIYVTLSGYLVDVP